MIKNMSKNSNLVIERTNNGLGDIIMCLPIFETIYEINPHINIYFDIQKRYSILLEDNSYCEIYNNETKDYYYDFNNGFEVSKNIHRTDLFANFLNIKPKNKKPIIYKRIFELDSEILIQNDYCLMFLQSANIYRQIPNYIAQKLKNIIKKLGFNAYIMSNSGIYIDDKFIKTTINDLFYLIKNSKLCIGPDSGPMHIAGGLDIPFMVFCNIISPDFRYKYYKNWFEIKTCLNLNCLYKCEYNCPYDIPQPCMKFFDFDKIESDIQYLLAGERNE